MTKEFEMSLMGELKFFLGLQIIQELEGIFINQSKYIKELLKKYQMKNLKPINAPMEISTTFDADTEGKLVDANQFRGMIGSLLYLTSSRPDIQFSVCLCARFQASLRESHLTAVKRIFRYLVGTQDIGLWYSANCNLELIAYTDLDYAGSRLDRKSTSGYCQFLGGCLVS